MRGAAVGIMVNVISAPVTLAVTGFSLARLGPERYGVWVMLSVFTSYLKIGDFGLSSAFARQSAIRIQRNEITELHRELGSISSVLATSGLAICLLAWFCRDFVLMRILAIPGNYLAACSTAFLFVLVATVIQLLTAPCSSVLVGAQRTDMEKKIAGTVNLLTTCGTGVVIGSGRGLTEMAAVQLAGSLTGLVLVIFFAGKVTNSHVRLFQRPQYKETWELLKFGGGLQITQTAMLVMTQVDRILLSHFVSIGLAGKYDAALKALYTVQSGLSQLISPLYPAAAALNSAGKHDELDYWLSRTSRLFAAIAAPVYGMIAIGSAPIVAAWLGKAEPSIALTLSILASAQALNHTCAPGYFLLLGTGNMREILRASIFAASFGVIVGLFGVRSFGFPGVVAAHATAIVTLFVLTARAIEQSFHQSIWKQLKLTLPAFAVGAIEGCLLTLSGQAVGGSRLTILALGAVLAVPGIIALLPSSYFTPEDRRQIKRFITCRLHLQRS